MSHLSLELCHHHVVSWRAWGCHAVAGLSYSWLGGGVLVGRLVLWLPFSVFWGDRWVTVFPFWVGDKGSFDLSCSAFPLVLGFRFCPCRIYQLVKILPDSRFFTFCWPLTWAWPAIISKHFDMHGPMRTLQHSCEGGRAAGNAHMSVMRTRKQSCDALWPPREIWGSSSGLSNFKFHYSALILGCLLKNQMTGCEHQGGVWEEGRNRWPISLLSIY